jgi:hypothetical protein
VAPWAGKRQSDVKAAAVLLQAGKQGAQKWPTGRDGSLGEGTGQNGRRARKWEGMTPQSALSIGSGPRTPWVGHEPARWTLD